MHAKPWFAPGAEEWLEERIQPDWRCFEWGSGGSTLWLDGLCAKVVSIEHDADWQVRVNNAVERSEVVLVRPTNEEPGDYGSLSISGCFRAYASAIDGRGPFDLVLVDGRARPACIRHAIPETRGILVLDNADRHWYREATGFLDNWERTDFRDRDWVTSAWTRP